MGRILLVFFSLLTSNQVLANSCCGQSPASFPVLSLSQKLSLVSSYSHLETQGRVYQRSDEFFVWQNRKRSVESLSLTLASSIADRHQVFAMTSHLTGFYSDQYGQGQSSNLSDTQIGYSFELLPEYSFSYWKPVVYVSALVNVPTGHSIYDSNRLSEGADVSGHNQWGAGLGLTVRKVFFPLTLTLQGKMIRLFEKRFSQTTVSSFYDSSLAALVSYSSPWFGVLFNGGLTFNNLSPRYIDTGSENSGDMQSFSVLMGLQKVLTDNWTVGANYIDQTWVGPARNTLLNRSIGLSINYNYF